MKILFVTTLCFSVCFGYLTKSELAMAMGRDIQVIENEMDQNTTYEVIAISVQAFSEIKDLRQCADFIARELKEEYTGNWVSILGRTEIAIGGSLTREQEMFIKFLYKKQLFVIMRSSMNCTTQDQIIYNVRSNEPVFVYNQIFNDKTISEKTALNQIKEVVHHSKTFTQMAQALQSKFDQLTDGNNWWSVYVNEKSINSANQLDNQSWAKSASGQKVMSAVVEIGELMIWIGKATPKMKK